MTTHEQNYMNQQPHNVPPIMAQEPAPSVKEWVLTLIILMIPLVNLVMLFVWGFGSATPKWKANFCKAYLLIMAVVLAIYLVIFLVFGGIAIANHA